MYPETTVFKSSLHQGDGLAQNSTGHSYFGSTQGEA